MRGAGDKGLADVRFGEAVRKALGFDLEEPDRLADWMFDPRGKGSITARRPRRSSPRYLAHRLWADLRKGWRFTNPNLEEAGLIAVEFPGLEIWHATRRSSRKPPIGGGDAGNAGQTL